MLELFAIFSKTGLLTFVHNPFQHEYYRQALNTFIVENFIYHHSQINEVPLNLPSGGWLAQYSDLNLGYVMVACYPKDIPQAATYIPRLFDLIKEEKDPMFISEDTFEQLLKVAESSISSSNNIKAENKGELEKTEEVAEVGSVSSKTSKKSNLKKEARKWDDQVDRQEQARLDYSSTKTPTPTSSLSSSTSSKVESKVFFKDVPTLVSTAASKPSSSNGFWSTLSKFTSKTLNEEVLDPLVTQLRDHLISKNVAYSLAERIADNVRQRLMGQVISSLGTGQREVKDAASLIIRPLVASESPSQFLSQITDHLKSQNDDNSSSFYTIVFVGVNGVGKSTTLAKVAAWLLSNNLRVMIVAGDTFRAGAVEQLKCHVSNLQIGHEASRIQLFEKGYGRDTASIVTQARLRMFETDGNNNNNNKRKFDVMLVDTAGRMPHNQPLMQALHSLIEAASPNRILFVGEALIGNDSLEQLRKFNEALSPNYQVDGLIVSKFDTVDEKVGTVLNLSYEAKAPIVFVGSGQMYVDLKTLSPEQVIDYLLN